MKEVLKTAMTTYSPTISTLAYLTTISEISKLWDFRSQRQIAESLMGCITSSCDKTGVGNHMNCVKDTQASNSTLTMPVNELEIDLTHFSPPKEILGIGGFGIVRRVVKHTCSDTGTSYALKSISKQTVLSRPSGTRAVMTELKALVMVSHGEHICGLKYAFQDDAFLYMVIEYASGGDMRYNLRKAPQYRFNELTAKVIIRQVISAVQHCHNSYILHRDVKPENILLYEDGHIKLSDFGVAKVLPDIEQCRSTSGTHGYMAPEIYADDHTHGAAFDWFCVGITLHEFLCGRRPYEATRLQRYYASDCIDRLELDYLPRMPVSTDCVTFVREILRPDPLFRLGGNGGETEIYAHPWLSREKPLIYDEVVTQLRRELPAFQELFDHKRNSTNVHCKRSIHRMNLSREEAVSLVRQHQEPCVISPEVQEVFRDFEYNTKVASPIYRQTQSMIPHRTPSLASTTLPADTSRSRSRSGSATSVGGTISIGLHPQQQQQQQLQHSRSCHSSRMRDSLGDDEDDEGHDDEDDHECYVEDVDNLDDEISSHDDHHGYHHHHHHRQGSRQTKQRSDKLVHATAISKPKQQASIAASELHDPGEMKDSDGFQQLQQHYLYDPNEPQQTLPYIPPSAMHHVHPKQQQQQQRQSPRTRPQSDRIVSYNPVKQQRPPSSQRMEADTSAMGLHKSNSDSATLQQCYKQQRRLSFPSPNIPVSNDEYPYALHLSNDHGNQNPRAISWRKTPPKLSAEKY